VHDEAVAEVTNLAYEDAPTRVGRVEPLVRVERDRVGTLDAGELGAEIVGEHRRSAVSGVDVEPEPLVGADVGDLAQGIDRSGRHRSPAPDDGDGADSVIPIGLDRVAKLVHPHAVGIVDRDVPQRRRAQPEHVRGPVVHDVRLRRLVDREWGPVTYPVAPDVPAGRAVTRRLQRDEIRHRSARNDQPTRGVRQAESIGEPTREVELDLGGGRRQTPPADVRVQTRREQVGDGSRNRPRSTDVRVEPRVAGVHRVLQHDVAEVREQVVLGHRFYRHVDGDRGVHLCLGHAARHRKRRE
jgi:hypothetical protein